MKHLQSITRRPQPAQEEQTSVWESLILLLLGIFFRDWDNYDTVSQNLEKFYGKTP